jgi:hypothetical protein
MTHFFDNFLNTNLALMIGFKHSYHSMLN